ncbi:MAG TPA: LPS export ABC transporter permease LptF [Thermoanaerobaculia bacterium]|nr:LPS export ABC transporter permease LptF [Thermoanaerobaculia bacterium]
MPPLARRLDRYILAETIGPLALGFTVYTFIMLIRFLFRSADMIIRRGLALREVGELVLLTIPNIVVLTIPMALLFGILIAIGRLASDSELIAMRATGVSLFTLYRPILALSLLLALGNTYLMAIVLPRANHSLQQLQLEIVAQTAARQVEPRVFYEEWTGHVLYVFATQPATDVWEGVFLAPSILQGQHAVTVAGSGRLSIDDSGERILLTLHDAVTHKMDLGSPGNYELIGHRRLDVVLEDQFTTSQRAQISASKGVRELTIAELQAWAADPDRSPELRRLARVEIHKKLAIPAACLVFGLFAVPLGFNNRRGGKSSGFALSIAVILVYYILLSNGEEWARVGEMPPWLAMWLPNLAFTAVGAFLLAQRNRDKSLFIWRLDHSLRHVLAGRVEQLRRRRARRRARRREARLAVQHRRAPDVVLRIPRFSLRFPNLLDRYVARLFGRVFLLVALSGLTLYIVADITDNLDDVLQHRPPLSVVVDYYLYMSLQIAFDIAPILVLVTTLITFSLLARTNEVTASKSLGVSLYRLAVPALVAAALVAASAAVLQAQVLPASNQKVAQLKDRIKGREAPRTYRRVDRQWLFGRGPYLFNFLYYDEAQGVLEDLQVFEFDAEYRITRRLFADQARWVEGRWVFDRGWVRSFTGAMEVSYQKFSQPRFSPYPEGPEYFGSEIKRPEQMPYRELQRYIAELEQRGQPVPEMRVELYNKVALPALSFVMALIALPFAFRLGRRGALYGIGLSLVLGMVLIGVFAFFSTLGETGALPPAVAVSAPSLLFASLSLYLFLGVRT